MTINDPTIIFTFDMVNSISQQNINEIIVIKINNRLTAHTASAKVVELQKLQYTLDQ